MLQFNYLDMHYGQSRYSPSAEDPAQQRRWQLAEEKRQRAIAERKWSNGGMWQVFSRLKAWRLKDQPARCCVEQ